MIMPFNLAMGTPLDVPNTSLAMDFFKGQIWVNRALSIGTVALTAIESVKLFTLGHRSSSPLAPPTLAAYDPKSPLRLSKDAAFGIMPKLSFRM